VLLELLIGNGDPVDHLAPRITFRWQRRGFRLRVTCAGAGVCTVFGSLVTETGGATGLADANVGAHNSEANRPAMTNRHSKIRRRMTIPCPELHNQALMMLAHEIFDPETNKRVLVDHAFIVAGGEITKAARNWIGNALDDAKRSQIMFIDRHDILNLYVVTNLPLPVGALPAVRDPWGTSGDEPPF
jgi:hypothetical protein